MSDGQKQLRNEIKSLTDKRCYFFLSAAGASIGFATTQIVGVSEVCVVIAINLAIALWGASFFFGYRSLIHEEVSLRLNLGWLGLATKLEKTGNIAEASEMKDITEKEIDARLTKVRKRLAWQALAFFLGSLIFALGQSLPIIINYADSSANTNEMSDAVIVPEKASP